MQCRITSEFVLYFDSCFNLNKCPSFFLSQHLKHYLHTYFKNDFSYFLKLCEHLIVLEGAFKGISIMIAFDYYIVGSHFEIKRLSMLFYLIGDAPDKNNRYRPQKSLNFVYVFDL